MYAAGKQRCALADVIVGAALLFTRRRFARPLVMPASSLQASFSPASTTAICFCRRTPCSSACKTEPLSMAWSSPRPTPSTTPAKKVTGFTMQAARRLVSCPASQCSIGRMPARRAAGKEGAAAKIVCPRRPRGAQQRTRTAFTSYQYALFKSSSEESHPSAEAKQR